MQIPRKLFAISATLGLNAACLYAGPSPAEEGTDTEDVEGSAGDTGASGQPTTGVESGDGAVGCSELNTQALDILEANCGGCHGPNGSAKAGFDYVLDVETLVASGKIAGGDPDGSPLLQRIIRGEMPPASAPSAPSAGEIETLEGWISQCVDEGDPPAACPTNAWVSNQQMFEAMAADVTAADPDDRPFYRYLTLVHLHNTGMCDQDIQVYRDALAKGVNALSRGLEAVPPTPVDSLELVFRIDLRDYEWDEFQNDPLRVGDKWDALVEQSPFAVEYPDDAAQTLITFTETPFPFQRADYFLHEATLAPNYDLFVESPFDLFELELELNIDVRENIDESTAQRAGFVTSGISDQTRVIERHGLPTGAGRSVWIAYDFSAETLALIDQADPFSHPVDFQWDQQLVLYSLPNGMHAYLILDGFGTRIETAPKEIITDPTRSDGKLQSGVSCIGCHTMGVIPAADEIRPFVDASTNFNAEEKDRVADLYPPPEAFKTLVENDNETYANTIRAAAVEPTPDFEPIVAMCDAYEDSLDLERAAAEIGVPPEKFLNELGRLDPELSALSSGTIKRRAWETLYAETVCELKLGFAQGSSCER